ILALDPSQKKAADYIENKIPARMKKLQLQKQPKEERKTGLTQKREDDKKLKAELEAKEKEEKRLAKLEAEKLEKERKAKEKEAKKEAELKRKQELDEKRKKRELEEERKREQKAEEKKLKTETEAKEKEEKRLAKLEAEKLEKERKEEFGKQRIEQEKKKIAEIAKEGLLETKEQKQTVDVLYKDSVDNYNKGLYDKARKGFEQVVGMDKRHKQAKLYLEEKIPQQENAISKEKVNSLYIKAVDYYNAGSYVQSARTFKAILSIDPKHKRAKKYLHEEIPKHINIESLKDEEPVSGKKPRRKTTIKKKQKPIVSEKTRVIKRPKKKPYQKKKSDEQVWKATRLYEQALTLYNSGQYEQALDKFKEVNEIKPNFVDTDFYLKRIPQDIKFKKSELPVREERGVRGVIIEEPLQEDSSAQASTATGTAD
ncbi:MAG: hypothetical protein ABH843_04910, partial [Candidatus Omnitrophota bacterium]